MYYEIKMAKLFIELKSSITILFQTPGDNSYISSQPIRLRQKYSSELIHFAQDSSKQNTQTHNPFKKQSFYVIKSQMQLDVHSIYCSSSYRHTQLASSEFIAQMRTKYHTNAKALFNFTI